jgi:hypothetical protein
MLFSFLSWWYGQGWLDALHDIRKRTAGVAHGFSMSILLRTLFAPWRRITTAPGKGLDAKFRALLDNLISRLVGFTVRLGVIIIALTMSAFTALFYLLIALVWPLIPIIAIYSLIRVVTG